MAAIIWMAGMGLYMASLLVDDLPTELRDHMSHVASIRRHPNAHDGRACTFASCFDSSRCPDGSPLRVYVYPHVDKSCHYAHCVSPSMAAFLQAIRTNGWLVDSPHDACLLVPPVDLFLPGAVPDVPVPHPTQAVVWRNIDTWENKEQLHSVRQQSVLGPLLPYFNSTTWNKGQNHVLLWQHRALEDLLDQPLSSDVARQLRAHGPSAWGSPASYDTEATLVQLMIGKAILVRMNPLQSTFRQGMDLSADLRLHVFTLPSSGILNELHYQPQRLFERATHASVGVCHAEPVSNAHSYLFGTTMVRQRLPSIVEQLGDLWDGTQHASLPNLSAAWCQHTFAPTSRAWEARECAVNAVRTHLQLQSLLDNDPEPQSLWKRCRVQTVTRAFRSARSPFTMMLPMLKFGVVPLLLDSLTVLPLHDTVPWHDIAVRVPTYANVSTIRSVLSTRVRSDTAWQAQLQHARSVYDAHLGSYHGMLTGVVHALQARMGHVSPLPALRRVEDDTMVVLTVRARQLALRDHAFVHDQDVPDASHTGAHMDDDVARADAEWFLQGRAHSRLAHNTLAQLQTLQRSPAARPSLGQLRDCTFDACFDRSRCRSGHFRVWMYPPPATLCPDYSCLSPFFMRLVRTIQNSAYYTQDASQACVFVPLIDLFSYLTGGDGSHAAMAAWTKKQPQWNKGSNHLIFDPTDWHSVKFDLENAIRIKHGVHASDYRPGFDIVGDACLTNDMYAPSTKNAHNLLDPRVQDAAKNSTATPSPLLLSFLGSRYRRSSDDHDRSSPELRNRINTLDNGADVLVFSTCKFAQEYAAEPFNMLLCEEDRVRAQTHNYTGQYDEILARSVFGLSPRGAGMHSYRVLEYGRFGVLPVVLGDYGLLPFPELIDWGAIAVQLPEHQYSLVPELLRRLPQDEVIQRRSRLREAFARVMQTTKHALDNGVFGILRKRLGECGNDGDNCAVV